MNIIKEMSKKSLLYLKIFLKWVLVSAVVGIIGGIVGSVFHMSLEYVTEFRMENTYITYFMPVGAVIIVFIYKLYNKGKLDTNLVIRSVKEDAKIPFILVPLIFLGTVITQLFGGSAGREGAALQIGGGIGYKFGRIFKFNIIDIHIITMAGMSSVFSALFSTPVTAAVFSLEVISVGTFNFTGLLPCLLSSLISYYVSIMLGIPARKIISLSVNNTSMFLVLKIIVLAICCAIICILFCFTISKTEKIMKKYFNNKYLRGIVGALIVVLLTVLSGTFDYNGAGMNIVERALSGEARTVDFIMKTIFTAITIAAGFKGGEIVPAFFVGATFGCVMGPVLGIESSFAAAIGMISVFCGVVNCPIASIVLSVEMFGANGLALFGVACAVSYIMSGNTGLYNSQNILYSKLTADTITN